MSRFVLCAAPLLLSFTALACATSHGRVATAESGAWRELATPHFVLKTDLDEDEARRVSAALEQSFAALSDVGFDSDAKPDVRIDVVNFAREKDYAEVAPALSSGVTFAGGRHDFERRTMIVLQGELTETARGIVQHELTHLLMRFYYPQTPVWLNEGFAKYFETLELADDHATLGKALPLERFAKGPFRVLSDPRGPIALYPMSEATRVADLVEMKPEQFYARPAEGDNFDKQRDASRTMGVHYETAWALVHFFMSAEAYRPTFDAYLKRLRAGEPNEGAWSHTLGQMPAEKLEADFRASLAPRETSTLRTAYTPPAPPAPQVRALDAANVHVLVARLRSWSTPESREAAARDLELAKASAPDDVERACVEAMLAVANGSMANAEALLRDAARAHPNDPRVWSALGWLLTYREQGAKVAELEEIARMLRPIAKSAAQLDLLGLASLASNDADGALAYEKRAVAVDPNCVDCLALASRAMLAKGLRDDALATLTLAMGIAPEGPTAAQLAQAVERIRRMPAAAPQTRKQATCADLRGPLAEAMTAILHTDDTTDADAHAGARSMTSTIARLRALPPISGAGQDAAARASALLERFDADTKSAEATALAKDRADATALFDDVARACKMAALAPGKPSPETKSAVTTGLPAIAQKCVASGARRSHEGIVFVQLVIEADGSVSSTYVAANSTHDPAYGACVADGLKALSLPPPSGGVVVFYVPVRVRTKS